jgi:hypothetical protein
MSSTKVTVVTNNTLVKKVVVGTPVRRVNNPPLNLGAIAGVDLTDVSDGALLVYNGTTNNFESKTNIDNPNTDLNGGTF